MPKGSSKNKTIEVLIEEDLLDRMTGKGVPCVGRVELVELEDGKYGMLLSSHVDPFKAE